VDSVITITADSASPYSITFYGHESSTSLECGDITAYDWQIIDPGGIEVDTGIQLLDIPEGIKMVYNNFHINGNYSVKLMVTDGCGNTDSETLTVTCNKFEMNIEVAANPVTINPGASSTITAYVTKANGDPVDDGTTVIFSTTAGTLSGTSSITTAGIATIELILDHNGIAYVTATVDSVSATATVICTAYNITVIGNPATVLPGGSSTITAYVTDSAGVPVANGTQVSFYTSKGTLSVTTATTTAGIATTVLTLMQAGDSATVIAVCDACDSAQDSTVVTCADNLYAMDVSASAASVLPGGSSTITAYLTQNGAPLAGATVTFAITTTGSGSIVPVTGITTAGGVATTVLTLNQQGEVATVTATYASTSGPVSDDVVVICADNLYQMDVQASAASVLPNGDSIISAYLTQNGAPLAGATVTFAITTTGSGSIIPVTGITNAVSLLPS
jgi:adhesin/invasin